MEGWQHSANSRYEYTREDRRSFGYFVASVTEVPIRREAVYIPVLAKHRDMDWGYLNPIIQARLPASFAKGFHEVHLVTLQQQHENFWQLVIGMYGKP